MQKNIQQPKYGHGMNQIELPTAFRRSSKDTIMAEQHNEHFQSHEKTLLQHRREADQPQDLIPGHPKTGNFRLVQDANITEHAMIQNTRVSSVSVAILTMSPRSPIVKDAFNTVLVQTIRIHFQATANTLLLHRGQHISAEALILEIQHNQLQQIQHLTCQATPTA